MVRFNLDQGYITCLPSNSAETFAQSETGQPIKLVNHTLEFNPDIKTIHPDVLALICLIAFYPFLKKSDEMIFPQNVSPRFREILKLHQMNPTILNDHEAVKPRIQSNYSGKALSWGGGLDSWAAHKIQPSFYNVIIHQILPDSPLPKFPDKTPKFINVNTNCRELAYQVDRDDLAAGWATWTQVLLGALWLSEDYKLGLIGLGGNLGSVYLRNGEHYYPTHLKQNIWHDTFKLIGLPLYIPLAGLSDLGVVKILNQTNCNFSLVKYCSLSETTENCHLCPKCLRKELLLGRDMCHPLDMKGPSIDYLQRGKKGLYDPWIHKYYQPAFQLLPKINGLEQILRDALSKYVEFLPKEEEHLVEHYGWELSST